MAGGRTEGEGFFALETMTDDEHTEVGVRIARARREAGLTQHALAGQLGITSRSVQNYEAGVVIPYRHLSRIESLTGKRPGWILAGDNGDEDLAQTLETLRVTIDQHQALLRDHLRMLRRQTRLLRDQRALSVQRRADSDAPWPAGHFGRADPP
jgi:transcriptional regulator with XRE-family HTH domain